MRLRTIILVVFLCILVVLIVSLCVYYFPRKNESFGVELYDTDISVLQDIDELSQPYIVGAKVDEHKLFYNKGVKMNPSVQTENLLLLRQFFVDYGITDYFIDCGTLLGAVREGGLIDGDEDADISMCMESLAELRQALPILESMGFISFRNSNSTWMAMSLLRKGEYIDIYNLFNTVTLPFETVQFPFLGVDFPVPKYYEEWLTELYGTWKIPEKDGKGLGNWELGMLNYLKNWSKRDLVVVTGVCKNYAEKLKNLVGSIHLYEPTIAIYVYDLGMTTEQVTETKTWKNIIYKKLTTSEYPSWLVAGLNDTKRNGLKQAAKLLIIDDLLHSIPNDILWLDAGNQIGGSLDTIRSLVQTEGLYTSCMDYDGHMKKFTHQGMLEVLGVPEYKGSNIGHVSTGVIGLKGGTNTTAYVKVIKPALECVLNRRCIEPAHASLDNHRYDASLLSALLHKNKLVVSCGSSDSCPSYNNCQEVTVCNSGQNNCPVDVTDHSVYTIQFQRGGGPKFQPRYKGKERKFELLRDIVHFRYNPEGYKRWVRDRLGVPSRLVDLDELPPILSRFDYCVGDSYHGSCKTVFCHPDKALNHLFDEIPVLEPHATRILVVMGGDVHSDKLSSEGKKRIQLRFSTIFWEANVDPDFLTLPMGLISCYVALQNTYLAERAILTAQHVTHRKLLCIPAWNTFSTELSQVSAETWASKAVGSRARLGQFINDHRNADWFDNKSWGPAEYYHGLSQYKFSACPTGNGIQAPKIFEALLTRTIPVVEDELVHRQLIKFGLPLVIVRDWKDMSVEYLSMIYNTMKVDWTYVIYLCSSQGVWDLIRAHT
jgi:hypothetical protein